MVVACRFFYFHIVVFYNLCVLIAGKAKTITKRIRRRGKTIVTEAHIASTNLHGEFCRAQVIRHTPFRSPSSDVAQVWGRCNIDLQFMPRAMDPCQLLDSSSSAEQPAVPEVDPKLALAMYGVRLQLPDAPVLRRCFHSIVAMFQAAHNCDFYITKYQGKPMEQLQSLLGHMATGLRRLEQEEQEASVTTVDHVPALQPADRARRTTLRLATAANRSSWCSCCELAIFIKTGSLARKTHVATGVFLARPAYLFEQCRRLLHSAHLQVIHAPNIDFDDTRTVDVLCFPVRRTGDSVGCHDVAAQSTHAQGAPADFDDADVLSDASTDASNILGDLDISGGAHQPGLIDSLDIAQQTVSIDERDMSGGAQHSAVAHDSGTRTPNNAVSPDNASLGDHSDEEEKEDNDCVTALTTTTSPHDDWLHRGPFLHDLDFHTYMSHVGRRPLSTHARVSDLERVEHVFLFDAHYALADSYLQVLRTDGTYRAIPVLEALRCPPPDLNNGEDNAVFKSLIGTLIKCPGVSRCADPTLCAHAFFPVTVPENTPPTDPQALYQRSTRQTLQCSRTTCPEGSPSTWSCRLQWKARRAEIEVLAQQAEALTNAAKRIPVISDTTLLRAFGSGGATQPAFQTDAPPRWLIACLTQVWIQKSNNAYPAFAHRIMAFLGIVLHHVHQLNIAQYSAYHLRNVILNLDMLAIARTTKLTADKKENAEDEPIEAKGDPASHMETEFYGGEGNDLAEDEVEEFDCADITRPREAYNHDRLVEILSRQTEIAAAQRKGRKRQSDVQMKTFDDCFHAVLSKPVPPTDSNLGDAHLSYEKPHVVNFALGFQTAVMKQMKTAQLGGSIEGENFDPNDVVMQAVLFNLQKQTPECEWIDLEAALRGPAHVARELCIRSQDKLSKPNKPYRWNEEQLQCIALFVARLEIAFARRPDPSTPWLHPADILMTIILDGGGGCGKTSLSVEILLPLLEAYFHKEGVLRRAPSNKPARLIGGRTMHSGQGLTPDNSMRTHALALNLQSRQKLANTHQDAGTLWIDEYSQLQGEMNHAASLRTTYAREARHNLNRNAYYLPTERYGRIPVLTYSGDHLQLPPVPAKSSLLAPLANTSNEHKVGASIFRNAELVFEFKQAMRFNDETQIAILEAMRTPGGRTLTATQWQALLDTEISASQPDVSADWYHSCYCWSVTSMASFLVARVSASAAKQPLLYVQAIDQPLNFSAHTSSTSFYSELLAIPSLQATKRLPGVALLHMGMRMRLTTTIQQPFAVQDVECTVCGIEPDPLDTHLQTRLRVGSGSIGEFCCHRMPKAVYVKLDDCDDSFLPPAPCRQHRMTGHDEKCCQCISAVQPGVFAVTPLTRRWKYMLPNENGKYITIARKQLPLAPAQAVSLYSLQGTTADPGLVAYWFFPQRCESTIKWLIVYVMLSRPRSLAQLKSVGLTDAVREIIEQGPPGDLIAEFEKLFRSKIKETLKEARQAAQRYNFLPGAI